MNSWRAAFSPILSYQMFIDGLIRPQHSPEVTGFNDFIWDSFWLEVDWRDYLVTVFVTPVLNLTCSCGSFGPFSCEKWPAPHTFQVLLACDTVTVLKTETLKGRLWCFCVCFIPDVTAHLACCSCTPPAGWNWTRLLAETTHNRHLWYKLNILLCDNFQQFHRQILYFKSGKKQFSEIFENIYSLSHWEFNVQTVSLA